MSHLIEDFRAFVDNSPTSWHAVEEMGNRLAILDFIPLSESEKWSLEPGKSYFVIRDGSLCGFSLPKQKPKKAALIATHTDSPALKIKPLPEIQKENMTLLGVETYGSPILASWLGRDLGIAGRVVTVDADQNLSEKMVFIDDAPLYIPFLAPHLDRESHEKGLLLNKQDHLIPIATLSDEGFKKGYLEMLLRRQFSFHTLLSFDLFLVPLESSKFIGGSNEMIASYRLDNLASAHAALVALGNPKKTASALLQMALFYDHEEIGSRTETGAESPFFSEILDRIALSYKMDKEELYLLKHNALCLSVDMAQAFNPNYKERYDPEHHALVGKGVVIKYHAGKKYVSHAQGAAAVILLCQKLNLNYQSYVNRSDIGSGSTVGPIFAAQQGITTVDIGCPQLSMHATREVMACQDYYDLCTLLTQFLQDS